MTPRSLLPLCALTAALAAQTNVAVTITQGTATYTQGALPTTEAAPLGGVLDAGTGNVLYQNWYFYRVSGDPREYAFKQDVTATRAVLGNTLVTTWPDVDGRGLFSAQLVQGLTAAGGGASLTEQMNITNLTNAQLDLEIFSYVDFDIAGSGTDNAKGTLSDQNVIDATNTVLSAGFYGYGNSATEVGPYPALRNKLTDAVVDNLAGWTGTFGPGDYTGAHQWSMQLPALGMGVLADELASLACRPDCVHYGTAQAGITGNPTIGSTYGVQRPGGSTLDVNLANGATGALTGLQLNYAPGAVTVLGINLLVAQPAANVIMFTNAVGAASFSINIAASPAYCGVTFFGQWIVADSAAGNGLASTTDGLRMVIGSQQ